VHLTLDTPPDETIVGALAAYRSVVEAAADAVELGLLDHAAELDGMALAMRGALMHRLRWAVAEFAASGAGAEA
jgi:hypothetical protein